MPLLNSGDSFPKLMLTVPGGKTVPVPDSFLGRYGVMLIYRGSWCPYCNAQLRAFQRASDILAGAGVSVAALSVDDEDATAALIAKLGLAFPVGYGARRIQDRGTDRCLRQPRPCVSPVDRIRPRPGGQGCGQRLFKRGHRSARP